MYEYNAIITNVVDGDTFDLNVDLGFNTWYKVRVRLMDIDTPETRNLKGKNEKELGIICKDYAVKNYTNKQCIIKTYKEPTKDSFGRYLIYCYLDGKNLVSVYNKLGINKLNESYSEDKVRELKKLI